VRYSHDLETTPLQIKTDSADGNGEEISVWFYTADIEYNGVIWLKFSDPPVYHIGSCSVGYTNLFPVDLPAEQTKIWTITETATTLKIECNEKEVLTYTFSDSTRTTECVPQWSRDTAGLSFHQNEDTASDMFRAKPGTLD